MKKIKIAALILLFFTIGANAITKNNSKDHTENKETKVETKEDNKENEKIKGLAFYDSVNNDVTGNIDTYKYVKGEEHDCKKLFSGTKLTSKHINK